jgi:hypothetical protein
MMSFRHVLGVRPLNRRRHGGHQVFNKPIHVAHVFADAQLAPQAEPLANVAKPLIHPLVAREHGAIRTANGGVLEIVK